MSLWEIQPYQSLEGLRNKTFLRFKCLCWEPGFQEAVEPLRGGAFREVLHSLMHVSLEGNSGSPGTPVSL